MTVTRWLRQHFNLIRTMLPALIVLGVLTVVGLTIRGAQTTTNTKLQALVVNGCARLNIKQREDNRNQLADYRFDSEFLTLLLHRPVRSRTQRVELELFVAPLRTAVRSKAWVPPVDDCSKVGSHYRLPHAIAFYQRLPPPSALGG